MDDDILINVSARLSALLPTIYRPAPRVSTPTPYSRTRSIAEPTTYMLPFLPPVLRPRPRQPLPLINESDVDLLISQARADSTNRRNESVLRRYEDLSYRLDIPAWPASSRSITAFITALVATGNVIPATINQYVGIVKSANKARGGTLNPMEEEWIRLALRGSQRALGTPSPSRTCTLTSSEIHTLAGLTPSSGRVGSVIACLVGTAALLRLQELANLQVRDVCFNTTDGHPSCDISIKSSKTDIGARGTVVAIGCVTDGLSESEGPRTDRSPYCSGPTCPVHRLQRWMAISHTDDDQQPLSRLFLHTAKE